MSIEKDDLLNQTKTDFYHRLLSDTALANVSILIDDEHDLDNRAKVDLGPGNVRNGKEGACIIVYAVNVLSLNSGETPTPLMEVSVGFEVLEDVLVNAGPDGTGWSASQIVARLVQLSHRMHIDEALTGFRLARSGSITEVGSEQKGQRGYLVKFEADDVAFSCALDTASVAISEDSGEITLTCPTGGTSIYYTTDGSYPGSGNPESDPYVLPFAAASGDVIRASAEADDRNASKYIARFVMP